MSETSSPAASARRRKKVAGVHRDPFDRLLVAEAVAEGLTLATEDDMIRRYPVSCL